MLDELFSNGPSILEDMLGVMQSDEARYEFLKKIYTPGDIEVADNYLDVTERLFGSNRGGVFLDVLKNEITTAQKQQNTDRYVDLTKRLIDFATNVTSSSSYVYFKETNIVGKLGNQDLVEYAISKLRSVSYDKNSSMKALSCAANIAKTQGLTEQANDITAKLIKMQKRYDPRSAAENLKALDRHSEVIDAYLSRSEFGVDYRTALKYAREHAEDQVERVAKRIFKECKPNIKSPNWENASDLDLYAEASIILGKEDNAISALSDYVDKAEIKTNWASARLFRGVVNGLLMLGEKEKAAEFVVKLERTFDVYKNFEQTINVGSEGETIENLAKLYHSVGYADDVERIYGELLSIMERKVPYENMIIETAERAFELTNNNKYLEIQLRMQEKTGKYAEAAKLAIALDQKEVALIYESINRRLAEARAE
ncbi:hypothetical protein ACFL0W_03560 [Nanoarchaeota archaeon]